MKKRVRTYDNKIIFENQDRTLIACPVCGTLVETDDICENCKWQNTGLNNVDGGPNKMTLEEARKAYAEGRPVK